jgi:hypothetical protein
MNKMQKAAKAASESGLYTVEDAKKPLKFFIEKEIENAIPRDGCECQVAKAIQDALPFLDAVEVGGSITKVIYGGRVIRYATSQTLRNALRSFDEGKGWNLPAGMYRLLPPKGYRALSKNYDRNTAKKKTTAWKNWRKKKNTSGTGMSVFKSRALPTRRISLTRPPKVENVN